MITPVLDSRWRWLLVACVLAAGAPEAASAEQSGPPAGQAGPPAVQDGPGSGSPILHNVRGGERLEMLVNTSRMLTLDKKIPQVQVNNPDIVVPTPISPYQIQIAAKRVGTTQVNLWDENKQVYSIDVVVFGDSREFTGLVKSIYPGASVRVVPVANGVLLDGTVDQPEHVTKIIQLAQEYYPKILSNITVVNVHQVLLHVKVMEVSRTKLRSLGIDWAVLTNSAAIEQMAAGVFQGMNSSGAPTVSGTQTAYINVIGGGSQYFAFLEALRQDDLVKIMADPTLVAYSGRPAQFQVGGEIGYPVSQGFGASTVEWKRYGTQLDFVPIVLGGGRLRLEVRPQVSEVDNTASWTNLAPAIKTRYVETGVEMRAGQTLAIAGLLQTRTEAQIRGLPVLSDIPYLGPIFRRVSERNNEVETLILVTPELVEPMDAQEVPPGGPGLNTTSPSDCQLYLKGEIEVPKRGPCATACSVGGFPVQSGMAPVSSPPAPTMAPGAGASLHPGPAGENNPSNPQGPRIVNGAGDSNGLPGFGGPIGYGEPR
jgi:pilus assembly protein CpaC